MLTNFYTEATSEDCFFFIIYLFRFEPKQRPALSSAGLHKAETCLLFSNIFYFCFFPFLFCLHSALIMWAWSMFMQKKSGPYLWKDLTDDAE